MTYIRRAMTVCGACLFIAVPVHAQTTVTWLHQETDPGIVASWKEIASDFEEQN